MKKFLLLIFLSCNTIFAQSIILTPGEIASNNDSTVKNQVLLKSDLLEISNRLELVNGAINNYSINLPLNTVPTSTIDIYEGAGVIKDNGGDWPYSEYAGTSNAAILPGTVSHILVTFELLDLGKGDTLIISDGFTSQFMMKLDWTDPLPKPMLIPSNAVYVYFKTNSNQVGEGFELNWKSYNKVSDIDNEFSNHLSGEGLVFNPFNSSLLIGRYFKSNYDSLGKYSVNFGRNNISSGYGSFVLGDKSVSSGAYSFAGGASSKSTSQYAFSYGLNAKASGSSSVAMGESVEANDRASIAMGVGAKATGEYSFAIGFNSTASGANSATLGGLMDTNFKEGAVMIGDSRWGATLKSAGSENRFYARFRNGYFLYTNATNSVGVYLQANGNSWSALSDSTKKENFETANLEEVLNSVSKMKIGTWNYKGQNSKIYRHWGVMAQDFYKHFGKDSFGVIGNDTTISSADFDGVSFAAIKGLEYRTRQLTEENSELKKNLLMLKESVELLITDNKELKVALQAILTKNEDVVSLYDTE